MVCASRVAKCVTAAGVTAAVTAAIGGPVCSCAGPLPPVAPEPAPVPMVEVEPLLLLAERTEGATRIVEIDAGEMLARAGALEHAGRWGDAVEIYDEAARRFPDTSVRAEALYRKGVCLERLEDHLGALQSFRDRLAALGDGPVGAEDLPALIHAGLLEESLGRCGDAAATYRRMLESPDLEPGDRRAARMRLGASLAACGDLDAAVPLMNEVIREADRMREAGEPAHPGPAAEARYRLGLLAAERMRDAPLDAVETEVAREQLVQKARRFSEAFEALAGALRGGSPYWAVAAGYEVGRMYLDVFDALVEAPLPAEMLPDQEEAYLAIVRARTRILLANALAAWEENLLRAERTGVRGPAVDATAAGIDRVRGIVADLEAARTELDDEAERLVGSAGEADPLAPFLAPPSGP